MFGEIRLGLYKSTQDLNEIPRCINPTVSQCRRSPNFPLLRGQFTSKPQEKPVYCRCLPPPRPHEDKPAAGRTRREPAGKIPRVDDSSRWARTRRRPRRSGLIRREQESGIRLDAYSVLHPCLRPRLPQGLEAETAATAGIRGGPGDRPGGTAGRRARRSPEEWEELLFPGSRSPAARMRPSGSPCALKSIYRQRNPRSSFLGIHSVVSRVFLFKTTMVGKTGRS